VDRKDHPVSQHAHESRSAPVGVDLEHQLSPDDKVRHEKQALGAGPDFDNAWRLTCAVRRTS